MIGTHCISASVLGPSAQETGPKVTDRRGQGPLTLGGPELPVFTLAALESSCCGGRAAKETNVDIQTVTIDKPEEMNVILGQAHFIKTLEDLYEVLAGSSPQLRFGIAFCESSGPRLVRRAGNDDDLIELAVRNARAVGAGHSFLVFLRDGYPLNVLNAVKQVPEVCRVICATANPVQVLVVETEQGRGIVGVVDGEPPVGVETDVDAVQRHELLRRVGYKL
jgi:adenosine/AMP kinase